MTQPHRILACGRLAVLLYLSLATMIGCQANRSNTKAVLSELRESMNQSELKQKMRSHGVVMISERHFIGGSPDCETQDYRLGDKVLRIWLRHPRAFAIIRGQREPFVSHWKFVDLVAERRQQKEYERVDKEYEKWLKMDPAIRQRRHEEWARVEQKYWRQVGEYFTREFGYDSSPIGATESTTQPGKS